MAATGAIEPAVLQSLQKGVRDMPAFHLRRFDKDQPVGLKVMH
jgi:hypothetical protein